MAESGLSHQHEWHKHYGTTYNVYGSSISHSDGCIPAIVGLPSEAIDRFAATTTDEELRQFLKVMETGSEDQQRDLIYKVGCAMLVLDRQ